MKRLAFALLLFLPGACAWLAPDDRTPPLDLPERWDRSGESERWETVRLAAWWTEYRDPLLERLIEEALLGNGDLQIALARLDQARAQAGYAGANQFPLVTAQGLAGRGEADAKDAQLPLDKPADLGILGAMVSYEVDLWGKRKAARDAAGALYLSARFTADATRLSVSAAVAKLYFAILASDADIAITEDTVTSRTEACRLVRLLYERQAVDGLTLRQSEAELAGIRARLPALRNQRQQAESALAVLLGRQPREIFETPLPRGRDLDALPVPPLLPPGTPSDLIRRRPDIAAAEQRLIAGNLDIALARAAYFPTISLASLLGVTSLEVDNLYSGTFKSWQIGATLSGPLIDFGRTGSGVDLATARRQEQIETYKNTLRTAFKEVRDALSARRQAEQAETEQGARRTAVADALRLARLRFAAGYSSHLEVLDAERSLYDAEIAVIAARRDRLDATVDLYKALGGGWDNQPPQPL